MKQYFVKTPKIIKNLFPDFIWQVATNKKEIYLTFDDGPIPKITPWVLDTLEKYKAKATFFCVGENITKHPEIFKQIIDRKHAIGNHTFNHLQGWKTDNSEYLNNINKTEDVIRNLAFKNKRKERREERKPYNHIPTTNSQQLTINLFRPPYGKIKISQSKELRKKGYQIIMWDVLSGDFDKKTSKEKCLENIIKSSKEGSIIVFHDSKKAFKNLEYALPKVLKYFSEKGFIFKAL